MHRAMEPRSSLRCLLPSSYWWRRGLGVDLALVESEDSAAALVELPPLAPVARTRSS